MTTTTTRRAVFFSIIGLFIAFAFGLATAPAAHAGFSTAQLLYTQDGTLYTANADSSNARALLSYGSDYLFFSPDNTQVMQIHSEGFSNDTPTNSLTLISIDGTNRKSLGSFSRFGYVTVWSPSGAQVAFFDDQSLYIVDTITGQKRTVASGKFTSIDWSPNGKTLLYVINTDPDNVSNWQRQLYSIAADGSNRKTLFSFYGKGAKFWFDGQRIVYNETQPDARPLYAESILVVRNQDGSNRQIIMSQAVVLGYKVERSLDGRSVLIGSIREWAVTDVEHPERNVRIFSNDLGIATATWSNVPNKIVVLQPINTNNTQAVSAYRLSEIDATSFASRTVLTTPTFAFAQGEGLPEYNLHVEPTGLVLFKVDAVSDTTWYQNYVVNIADGRTVLFRSNGGGGSSNFKAYFTPIDWRPNPFVNTRPEFQQVWWNPDSQILLGKSNTSWLWGPEAFANKTESYKEASGSTRSVAYFDKARMEMTNPDGDRGSRYFVTNGLLPRELIGGKMQLGDNTFQQRSPAAINVAGDPNGSITYTRLAGVTTLDPGVHSAANRSGQPITATIDRNGTVTEGAAMPGVTNKWYISETKHNIPDVFVNYFGTLPQDWVYVMGFPLSEAYQTDITLDGKSVRIVVQVYERRVLTYTPTNNDPYKVEQGNVGRHYYQWRYGN